MPARTLLPVALACLLTACVHPTAVRDFVTATQQASALFPSVASIGYDVCAERQRYDQLKVLREFDAGFRFDDTKCAPQKRTRDRLTTEYKLLDAYFVMLGKVAADGSATAASARSATQQAASMTGASSAESQAVAGLVSVLSDAFLNSIRQRDLKREIEKAQPHVHKLCAVFEFDLRAFDGELETQESSLASFYGAVHDHSPGTSPVILTKSFQADLTAIENRRTALKNYISALEKIDKTHTDLFDHRDRLFEKATLTAIADSVASLGDSLNAVKKTL